VVMTAAFAWDGATFATSERDGGADWGAAYQVKVRSTATGKSVCSLPYPGVITPAVCFSKDGSHLLARSLASVTCWDLGDVKKPPRKAQNPSRRHFGAMAVHPDGPLLTVDNDRLVRVWDVPALTTDRAITWNIGKLHAVAVSPDGTRAAVGSHTGKVLVWDWD